MMNLVEHSNLIRERSKQPIVINGETFVTTVEYAAIAGHPPDYFHKLARPYHTVHTVTMVAGHRFVRIPRHNGDMHPPIYWCAPDASPR